MDVASDIRFQKDRSVSFAPSRPPTAKPWASTVALTAPALDAVMPSKREPLLFQQAIEDTPGEGAMTAAALERQIDGLLSRRRGALNADRMSWLVHEVCRQANDAAVLKHHNWNTRAAGFVPDRR